MLFFVGNLDDKHLDLIAKHDEAGEIQIVGVIDENKTASRILASWNRLSLDDLGYIEYDYIVLLGKDENDFVLRNLIQKGIRHRKILLGRILDIPLFEWNKYIGIYEEKVSIISCNCMGGILYNTLGMECLSPFKNLWVKAGALIHKYEYLQDIMAIEPKFMKWEIEPHSGIKYPVGYIKEYDFEIHFNHDESWEVAIEKWNRRSVKINYKNLLLLVFTDKLEHIKRFSELIQCGYKGICFVPDSVEIGELENCDKICRVHVPVGQELYEILNSSMALSNHEPLFDLLELVSAGKKYKF